MIQIPRRLVQHQQLWVLSQGPRDGDLLLFSAGKAFRVSVGKFLQSHFPDDLLHSIVIGSPCLQPEIRDPAHENGIIHAQFSEMDMLRDIGDPSCTLPERHGEDILPIQFDPASGRSQKAKDDLEQCGLSGAVFSKEHANLPFRKRKRNIPEYRKRMPAVLKREVFDLQHQCFSLPEKIMAMKNGAPKRDVTAPTGSADPRPILRARVSASKRRRHPARQEAGMVRR